MRVNTAHPIVWQQVKKAADMPDFAIAVATTTDSPALARAAVARFCGEQGLRTSIVDEVLLVVSELVTNAILHGRAPVELHASSDGGCLRIAVRDADPAHGADATRELLATAGRGLGIVASVADQTGVERRPDSKTVWASWNLPRR